MVLRSIAVLFLAFSLADSVGAQVYKCKDARGQTLYSTSPCADAIVVVPATPNNQTAPSVPVTPSRREAAPPLQHYPPSPPSPAASGYARDRSAYMLEVSHNDEFFIINDQKFSAQTYCFNMEEGDPVLFIDGNAMGVCATATVVNLRTKNVCQLWCE